MRRLIRFLTAWFTSQRQYAELTEEMNLHMELRARKLGQQHGLSQTDAASAARKRFGNSLQLHEECREAWGARRFDELLRDLIYAGRMLRRNPLFTFASVLTLALGIAANTAIFAFIDALILRPLPVPHADRLALLTMHEWTEGVDMPAFCYPAFQAIAGRAHSLQGLFVFTSSDFALGWGADAHRVPGSVASGSYYATLGRAPFLGRFFGANDDVSNAPPVAVLSYRGWLHEFSADRSVIGRTIHLDGHPFTIVGVEPRGFPVLEIGTTPEITIPFHANAMLHPQWDMLHTTSMWWLSLCGRLRPGVTMAQANAEMNAITGAVMDSLHMNVNAIDFNDVHSTHPKQTFGATAGEHGNRTMVQRFDKPLYVLICISLVVLGIGSLNIANLLLSRATARERELAVRLALGAGRRRIIRQLLTESLLLSGLGTVTGVLLAIVITRFAGQLLVPVDLSVDWRVLGFVASIGFGVTLLFGLAPAIRGVALGSAALKFGRVGRVLETARLNQFMVCAQVALSLLLVSSAFLFSKSFYSLLNQDPGFTRKNLVLCGVDMERSGMNASQAVQFYQYLMERLRATPSVSSAAVTAIPPLSGNFAWEDLSAKIFPSLTREQRKVFTHRVSPSYFKTLGIAIIAGRDFNETDATAKLQSAVLSEQAAHLYFPRRSPIGELLPIEGQQVRIVGIVKDALYQSIRDAAPQTLYFDLFHTEGSQGGEILGTSPSIVVRTTAAASAIGSIIRDLVKKSGRDLSADAPMTFDQQTESLLTIERLLAFLASGFALLGCLLAAIGLYGIIGYSIARRTSEIGVRMALGANRADVVWTVFGEAVRLGFTGSIVGVALAFVAGHFIAGLLYHTPPIDPSLMAASVSVLVSIVILAGLLPAIRAARIDPMTALRWE